MKIRSTLLGLLLGASMAASAHAGEVDFTASPTGVDTSLGVIAAGQYGNISDAYSSLSGVSIVAGFLPTDEEITFTYTLAGGLTGALTSNGTYTIGSGSSTATTNPVGTTNTVSSNLLLATASFPNSTTGKTTVINDSGEEVSFLSLFNAFFGSVGGSVTKLTYNAVSTVPLPASLLLFGTAVLGMFGFGWNKRKGSSASAAQA